MVKKDDGNAIISQRKFYFIKYVTAKKGLSLARHFLCQPLKGVKIEVHAPDFNGFYVKDPPKNYSFHSELKKEVLVFEQNH